MAGITQEEHAMMSGLSQGYINQLESGKRKYTQKSLELIANALSKPVREFFGEENEEIPLVSEKEGSYLKKRSYEKEFIQILNDLPEHIVEHYLTLLKLEREVLMKNKRTFLQKRDL